ncbi:MAG: DUF1080 domain-containing protein [Hyphomonadaceae bacterium]
MEQGGDRSPEGQWRALFDGHTLDGWTPKIRGHALGDNYRDTFRVQDGAIRVSYDRYDQFSESYGHLFYQAPFRFYRLRLEYRFYAPPLPETPDWARYNSGVMILSQPPETMAQSASFPVSIEAQILGPVEGEARTNGNVCTPGTHIVLNGQLETRHCINSRTSAQPNGQWHSIEIDVLPDGRIIHRLNGAVVMEYSGAQLDPDGGMADSKPLVAAQDGRTDIVDGYISLQSEGSPIEFRNIEVMTLD